MASKSSTTDTMDDDKHNDDNILQGLVSILDRPEQEILTLLTASSSSSSSRSSSTKALTSISSSPPNHQISASASTRTQLIEVAQYLFRDIESLGSQYKLLRSKSKSSTNNVKPKESDHHHHQHLNEDQLIQPGALSGLAEMFVPTSGTDDNTRGSDGSTDNNHDNDDEHDDEMIETVFGQVELQNDALRRLLKSSLKRLTATTVQSTSNKKQIRILDLDQINDDDDEDEDEHHDTIGGGSDDDDDDDNNINKKNDSDHVEDDDDDDHDDDDDDNEDEDARRIRERMERAMDDMEEEEEQEADSQSGENELSDGPTMKKDGQKEEEELFDPVAEDLKDGFFDLNEMEAFADEEEDYLPDEAFGQPDDEADESDDDGDEFEDDGGGSSGGHRRNKSSKDKKKTKKSFHQRQRDGDLMDDEEDDDEEGADALDDLYEEVKPMRRKKYREQEDIDALYNLYQSSGINDDQGEGDDDYTNGEEMTATDFFGAPKKKYIEQYKKNHPEFSSNTQINRRAVDIEKKEVNGNDDDDDDDSWGEYDFEKEDQIGWQDEGSVDVEDDGKEIESDNQEDDEEEENDELMNDEMNRSQSGNNDRMLSKQESRLRNQTAELEKELLSEKPWQMRGETKSTSRPLNSLLASTPEFEMASKQAPTITVQHTASLEDIIKKRILAEDWDDVVPRELPDVGWHKKRGEMPEVSQEKSKLGLGELYEREYLKKAVGYDVEAAEKQTEEEKAKDEMKQLFANLCSKLDALSNYHFAPRPIADEAEVRAVTQPAIAMEEVLPLHVSDARGVAPEEVYATKRGRQGILRSETELDQPERKRQRQSKKAARRKARKEKLADEKLISRLQPGLGLNNPYEKRKAREELAMARSRGKITGGQQEIDTKFGSSGTFFKRLQAEAQQTIHTQAAGETSDYVDKTSKSNSSAFKL